MMRLNDLLRTLSPSLPVALLRGLDRLVLRYIRGTQAYVYPDGVLDSRRYQVTRIGPDPDDPPGLIIDIEPV